MSTGFSSLVSSVKNTINWVAQNNLTGQAYNPNQNQTPLSLTTPLGTAAANAAPNGADSLCSFIQTLAANTFVTLNLRTLTDILGNALTFARVKAIGYQLLSTANDSVNGTACTGVSIQGGTQNPFYGPFAGTLTLGSGEPNNWVTPNAAGYLVTTTQASIKITNLDSVNTAALQVTYIGGSN